MLPSRLRAQRLVLVLLGCSFPLGSSAQAQQAQVAGPSTSQPYDEAIQAAVQSFNAGEFVVAREHFGKAHALRPSARTWRGLGASAFELGEWASAVNELTFALEDTRSALPPALRDETELMLRVARRRGGEVVPASVPVVQPPPAASAATQGPSVAPANPVDTLRVAALITGGLGVAGVASGIAFGVQSMAEGRERDKYCNDGSCLDQKGVNAARAAIRAGNVSTVSWIVGGVALGAGVLLWLWPHNAERKATAWGFGVGSVELRGRF